MNISMSLDEQITLESYDILSITRPYSHNNPFYWVDAFSEFKNYLPTGSVVDIGCGIGRDALMFSCSPYKYLGIDGSEGMIEHARLNMPCAEFDYMNMYDLTDSNKSFPDNSFDGFWSVCSLIHVERENLDHVLSGISRVVKSAGVGFVVVREGTGDLVIEEAGLKRKFILYDQEGFYSALAKNNFEVLDYSFDDRDAREFTKGFLTYFVKNKK